jgi:arylsulfatase A-like enzyme
LVESFSAAGYRTLGAGKISHSLIADWWDAWRETDYYVAPQARDVEGREGQFDPGWRSPYDGEPIGRGEHFTGAMLDWGPSGVSSTEQPDGVTSRWVCEQLRQEQPGPFFLAYGVTQPHTPWRVPQRFFDLHPLDEVVVPESRADDLDDLGDYVRDEIVIRSPLAMLQRHGLWREAVQAYQAAISFADWCVGQVLDELAASPHAENTIVVLWSDHGYHLGEKLHWHKLALWERATRVPFLLHVPGQPATGRVAAPVSLLDVGPTLAELCGLELDPAHEGASLLRVLEDPGRAEDRPPITTWRPGNHSVRQGPYRYIRYETGDRELYDHRDDPGELRNLSGAASARSVMDDLEGFLPRAG